MRNIVKKGSFMDFSETVKNEAKQAVSNMAAPEVDLSNVNERPVSNDDLAKSSYLSKLDSSILKEEALARYSNMINMTGNASFLENIGVSNPNIYVDGSNKNEQPIEKLVTTTEGDNFIIINNAASKNGLSPEKIEELTKEYAKMAEIPMRERLLSDEGLDMLVSHKMYYEFNEQTADKNKFPPEFFEKYNNAMKDLGLEYPPKIYVDSNDKTEKPKIDATMSKEGTKFTQINQSAVDKLTQQSLLSILAHEGGHHKNDVNEEYWETKSTPSNSKEEFTAKKKESIARESRADCEGAKALHDPNLAIAAMNELWDISAGHIDALREATDRQMNSNSDHPYFSQRIYDLQNLPADCNDFMKPLNTPQVIKSGNIEVQRR